MGNTEIKLAKMEQQVSDMSKQIDEIKDDIKGIKNDIGDLKITIARYAGAITVGWVLIEIGLNYILR